MNSGQRLEKTFNNPFIPLRQSNFRAYWLGMSISLIGTWMQSVAQPWLAYSLTHSALLLGLVGAMQYLPVLLFSLFAGVLVDRWPIKKLLYFTQAGSLLITLLLALLAFSGQVRYWHILVLATALGLVNSLDMPARQAFVIQLVGKEDLMNSIALNAAAFNGARVIGPAIAGILMAIYGPGICFLINSLSFAAMLVSLAFIQPLPLSAQLPRERHLLAGIKEGLGYVYQHRQLLEAVVLLAIIGTFAMNNNVLVPVFAQEVLHQGEQGLGFLFAFTGIGSLIGSMLVASMSRSGPQRSIIHGMPFVIALFLVLTSYTHNFWLVGFYLAATGLFFNLFSATVNTILQIDTRDDFRGRVMSIYSLVFVGSTPVGNLYAGSSAQYLGAQYGFLACGAIVMVCLLGFYVFRGAFRVGSSDQAEGG